MSTPKFMPTITFSPDTNQVFFYFESTPKILFPFTVDADKFEFVTAAFSSGNVFGVFYQLLKSGVIYPTHL
jgi:hypothetical protein